MYWGRRHDTWFTISTIWSGNEEDATMGITIHINGGSRWLHVGDKGMDYELCPTPLYTIVCVQQLYFSFLHTPLAWLITLWNRSVMLKVPVQMELWLRMINVFVVIHYVLLRSKLQCAKNKNLSCQMMEVVVRMLPYRPILYSNLMRRISRSNWRPIVPYKLKCHGIYQFLMVVWSMTCGRRRPIWLH